MRIWKIALVGCGDIAEHVYMPQMPRNKRVEVVACCDLKPERTAFFQDAFGIPQAYANVDDLLGACDFDILMDVASIPAHYEINMKALRAGKHLYSQKPVGLTPGQATEMIEAAAKAGVKFSASPVHMLRDDIRLAKSMIADGAIGKVSLVRAVAAHGGPEYFQYRANDPSWFYEPGAGALYDLGVHALTMATGILGPAKEATCVAAVSEPLRTVRSGRFDGKRIQSDRLYDNYNILLDFGNGAIANLVCGFCLKGQKASSLEIYGDLGAIHFGNDGLEVYYDDPQRKIRGWIRPEPQSRPADAFFHCMCIGDLVDAIERDRPTGLPPEHARHVVELMCEIEASAKTGTRRAISSVFYTDEHLNLP
ncbi:MAG: Gfo/Idh/MocA family oxidoreductase [Clostridiales bacterium]|jgi:predicted dehydrogenase|nr:Gfo/Idh/MocA family oxidoreductase [Clostridiales bacterium]